MKAELLATPSSGTCMAANFVLSAIAIALGTFVAAMPHRAAKLWGSRRLAKLAPERRTAFIIWYRTFGIVLCLSGILLVVDNIVFSNYPR
ncbi:MAG: hypothetical protein ABSD20_01865 [Terriglobales bacterium]|jgi:hypothetical protein